MSLTKPTKADLKADRKTFIKKGQDIYGVCWKTRVAHALKVDVRTVRRWANGGSPVPSVVMLALEAVHQEVLTKKRLTHGDAAHRKAQKAVN